MIRDRRHWEFAWGRWRLARWCPGAPCHLTADRRHPITVWKVRT